MQLSKVFYLCLFSGVFFSCDDQLPTHRVQTDTLEAVQMRQWYHRRNRARDRQKHSSIQAISLPEQNLYSFKSRRKSAYKLENRATPLQWRVMTTIDGVKVRVTNTGQAIMFTSGMSIDADGSPRAYHPKNTGLDDLKHAGKNGKWWALATRNGKPVIQRSGYYVSTTSLQDFRYSPWDQRRYVNAEKIPYIVLPPKVKKIGQVSLGDLAVVYNTQNHRWTYAIYADTGADTRIGEGSIALAKLLGINADARKGGISQGIVYTVFPGSGVQTPLTLAAIQTKGFSYFYKFGGLTHLKTQMRKYR
ncbi:MAG TPA: hypothetical protein DCS93_39015 [Microscillaceae bacterium]|nr:hypothetical protein [Microscillaceae bacterium]